MVIYVKVNMSFDGKHLTLENRKTIEENISNRVRKYIPSIEINKSPSTIWKEIRKNRKRRYFVNDDAPWMCKYYNECKVCISRCHDFEELPCTDRDRFIGACNGCKNIRICKKNKNIFIMLNKKSNLKFTKKEMEIINLRTI